MDAKNTYMSRQRDVAQLLDWLTLELERHAEYARKEGLTWAHVGDLGHVREKLIETQAFLAQQDERDIEMSLADGRTSVGAGKGG